MKDKVTGPNSRVSDSAGLGWGPRICIFNKFPGTIDTAGLETTRGESLGYGIWQSPEKEAMGEGHVPLLKSPCKPTWTGSCLPAASIPCSETALLCLFWKAAKSGSCVDAA